MHNAAMKSLIAGAVLIACTTSLAAQSSDSGYTASLRNSWNRIKRLVASSAQAMPDEHYAFKPSPDVRTFGQLIGHLANEHYLLCSPSKGEKNPKEGVDFEKQTTKAELIKALADSNAYCDSVYAGLKDEAKNLEPSTPGRRDTPFSSLLMNVTHDSEHYGNIVTYLRMKGIVPPSSQPTR
jgi:uncharacterized damage-inducible protein DinB